MASNLVKYAYAQYATKKSVLIRDDRGLGRVVVRASQCGSQDIAI